MPNHIQNGEVESCESVNPYDNDSRRKTEQVREMFDNIAPAYDFMNRAMTFGIDRLWRRKAVGMVASGNPDSVLDIATGTGDLAIELAGKMPYASITGIDLSEGMIEVGRKKIAALGLENRIALMQADSLSMPFEDNSFRAITVAYGVRNFENLLAGYREMYRVLAPGGTLTVVELSKPVSWWAKPLYRFYTRAIIPLVGRLVSRDTRAYSYLPESIAAVPQRGDMTALMSEAGFEDASFRSLTFGVCTIYSARKKS